jgi:hypothetical protein
MSIFFEQKYNFSIEYWCLLLVANQWLWDDTLIQPGQSAPFSNKASHSARLLTKLYPAAVLGAIITL